MKPLRWFRRATAAVAALVEGLMAALLGLLVLLVGGETLAWTFFHRAWHQGEEVAGILLIWFGFLGAAWGVRAGVHLAVELLVRRLPPPAQRWVRRLDAALLVLFGLLLVRYGAALAGAVTNTLPATGWRASTQYVPAVAAGALIALFGVERLVGSGAGSGPGSGAGPGAGPGGGVGAAPGAVPGADHREAGERA